MKQVNLWFGILLFFVFLGTGYYMEYYFKPNHFEALVQRMQIRSSHIYILFVALLNMLSYKTKLSDWKSYSNYVNILYRFTLLLSGIFSIIAFVYEHDGDISNRLFTLLTVMLALTSVGVLLVFEFFLFVKKRSKKSKAV